MTQDEVKGLLEDLNQVIVLVGVSRTVLAIRSEAGQPQSGASILAVNITTGEELEVPIDAEAAGLFEQVLLGDFEEEEEEDVPAPARLKLNPAQSRLIAGLEETLNEDGEETHGTTPFTGPRAIDPVPQL